MLLCTVDEASLSCEDPEGHEKEQSLMLQIICLKSLANYDQLHKSGYVSIVGKTNAGKSTFTQSYLGQKIAITSRKPQTTRHSFSNKNRS